MMENVYPLIRERALEILAQYPKPRFYGDFERESALSRELFETDAVLVELKRFVARELENDFGHGIDHAEKVTIDAGTLIIIECESAGVVPALIDRRVFVVQCAALLHDIRRKEKNHAVAGSEYAKEILVDWPLTGKEIEIIRGAIRNHEAFREIEELDTPEGNLIADCLYDADKFRWGPDNFRDTVWDMSTFLKIPLEKFVELYPKGMESLVRISNTFRTKTGKKYGPGFIEIGLNAGEKILEIITRDFLPAK